MKPTTIELKQLDEFCKLIEAQRELVYHLQKYKEDLIERKKEMEILIVKAQRVMRLKSSFSKNQKRMARVMSEEDIKTINQMLAQRHIRV